MPKETDVAPIRQLTDGDVAELLSELRANIEREQFFADLTSPGAHPLGPIAPEQAANNAKLSALARGQTQAYRSILEKLGQSSQIAAIEEAFDRDRSH